MEPRNFCRLYGLPPVTVLEQDIREIRLVRVLEISTQRGPSQITFQQKDLQSLAGVRCRQIDRSHGLPFAGGRARDHERLEPRLREQKVRSQNSIRLGTGRSIAGRVPSPVAARLQRSEERRV